MSMEVLDGGVLRPAAPEEQAEVMARRLNASRVQVPASVEMLQARLALIAAGHFQTVNAFIASMPGDEGDAARAYWDFAKHVVRDDPLVAMISQVVGLSGAQIDQLFIHADTL